MIKIGIELNNVVRDINTQIIKYYKKDIDKSFDDTNFNKNVLNVIDGLNFDEKKGKYNFLYIDYPYEIFGCAKPMHKNLSVMINNFLVNLGNIGESDSNVCFFSLKENALTIQSTYFFLSKIGSRIRRVIFPIIGEKLWNEYDVLITTNANIVNNKPKDKKVVLIKKDDNTDLIDKCDLVYDSLFDLLSDEEFLFKLNNVKSSNNNFLTKISNKIKKIFRQ